MTTRLVRTLTRLGHKLDTPVGQVYIAVSGVVGVVATAITFVETADNGLPLYTKVARYDPSKIMLSKPAYLVAATGKILGTGVMATMAWPVFLGYSLAGENGEVYACGRNTNGQLGLGDTNNRNTWTSVNVPILNGVVKTVIAGYYHSFLLLENGEVYACGYNNDGQLGLGDTGDRNIWTLVNVPGVVKTVIAVYWHSFLLLENGEVYACGDNRYGQLGLGNTNNRDTWTRINVPTLNGKVKTVIAGNFHSFLLLENGEVYACGYNYNGQLGLGDTTKRNTWTRINLPTLNGTVKTVIAGGFHSFLLLESGEVYACGSNADGQLGHYQP
jgi:alpha-tubulin suppressor-like RCC1 family protein